MESALPCEKPPIWNFTISFDETSAYRLSASTVFAKSANDVEEFGAASGLEVTGRTDRNYGEMRWLKVREPEDSPKLNLLIQALKRRYGIKPSEWFIVPEELRDHYFGVRKEREFSDKQMMDAEYLRLIATRFQIGTHSRRSTPEDETYYVKNDGKQGTKVEFGFISTFAALGISQGLKERIEAHNLKAILFDPITVRRKDDKPPRKPLWKVHSNIILPRTCCRYIDAKGHVKEPYDDWSYKWECAYFDDAGHVPTVLSYHRKDIEAIKPFDIAMTAEKLGNGPFISFRHTIVSQRFRKMMNDMRVKGVGYHPVVLK
ncbi:MAG: hypothetical protein AAGA58_08025 [Verrucomicrobiota bacterium]